jgi:hypothetical protein
MNIADVQLNDEIVYNGISYIVTEAPKKLSNVGEMAHTIRVEVIRTAKAGIHPDGTLEFGTVAHEMRDLDDTTDVEVIRSNVRRRNVIDYPPHITTEQVWDFMNGGAAPVPGRSIRQLENERACRAELARVALRRNARLEQGKEEEISFRTRVRQAVEAGISVSEIRETTGLSRERIYQIRDGRR